MVTILHSFSDTDGSVPNAHLIQGSDGNFYGTTLSGGPDGSGTVFQLTSAGTLTSLHSFSVTDGYFPLASVVQGSNGNFYGTTSGGGSAYSNSGSDGNGTVFGLNVVPSITNAPSAMAFVGEPFNYQIAATNDPTSYDVQGLPSGLVVDPTTGLIAGTPTATGASTLVLSATNGLGTGTATVTLTINIPPPPVITSSDQASGAQDSEFSYQITATNNPNSYGAQGLPNGLKVNTTTGLISGAPTESGTYTVTLSATNAGGTGTGTLTLSFAADLRPMITGRGSAKATLKQAFSYQIDATHGPTSYSAQGLPTKLTVNTKTGLISGTPTVAGVFTVKLTATNAFGTGGANLTLEVDDPAAKPVISSATTGSAAEGTAFSYQIGATNNPTSYGAANLPAGLSVNTSTGLISGTPTVTTGSYSVTISATNAGGTGSATLRLSIAGNPGTLAWGTSSYSVDEDAGSITVHVLRSGGSAGAASVLASTSGGTAKSGTDYTGLSQTLTWADGDTSQKAFRVAIKDLGIADGSTRQFSLKLASATGATLGSPTTATVTIKENDPKQGDLEFAAGSYSVAETAGTLTVQVNRTAGTTGAVTVVCGTSSGTAKSGTDYTGKSTTLTWAAGDMAAKSFSVKIINRGSSGGHGLTFSVVLSSPGGGANLGSPAAATVTIN